MMMSKWVDELLTWWLDQRICWMMWWSYGIWECQSIYINLLDTDIYASQNPSLHATPYAPSTDTSSMKRIAPKNQEIGNLQTRARADLPSFQTWKLMEKSGCRNTRPECNMRLKRGKNSICSKRQSGEQAFSPLIRSLLEIFCRMRGIDLSRYGSFGHVDWLWVHRSWIRWWGDFMSLLNPLCPWTTDAWRRAR